MKTRDVMVGGKYLCRVGNNLVTVEVVHRIDGGIRPTGRKEPDMFRVRRVGATKDLPNARSAAALRLIPVRKIEASSTYGKMGQWLRTCQECGHKILTSPPDNPPTDTFLNQTCHHCHSSALDFGSESQNKIDANKVADDGLQATAVSKEFYLSAAEQHIGWCTSCHAFRGQDLEPDSRECECPECHHNTLYGADIALLGGLIIPVEDE
jgi:hypothetical protein